MRTALILIQAGFLSVMVVIGAYGNTSDKVNCPLPAPAAQHCAADD